MGYKFFVTVKGKKMGVFKGESTAQGGPGKDKILGLGFSYELKSPRDVATGQASGKRQHLPIKIVKEWGASTPQFFQALVNNEVLSEVKLEFLKTNANGEEYVYYTIRMTDARVAGIRQFTSEDPTQAASAKHGSSSDARELEEVSLTFMKIEVENADGKTMGADDWHAN